MSPNSRIQLLFKDAGNKTTTLRSNASATAKEVKRRAKRVKEELSDIGDAVKEVGNQVGDVAKAVKGKPRTGRKKKATKK